MFHVTFNKFHPFFLLKVGIIISPTQKGMKFLHIMVEPADFERLVNRCYTDKLQLSKKRSALQTARPIGRARCQHISCRKRRRLKVRKSRCPHFWTAGCRFFVYENHQFSRRKGFGRTILKRSFTLIEVDETT